MEKKVLMLIKLSMFIFRSKLKKKGFYNPQSNYKISFLFLIGHACLVFFIEFL